MRTEDSKPQAEQSQPPKHRCKQGLFQEITIACFETPRRRRGQCQGDVYEMSAGDYCNPASVSAPEGLRLT